jgi:translation elongation factor EF-1alpha
LQFLDNFEVLDRNIDAPFMLPVSEKYNELGTCCMGKVGELPRVIVPLVTSSWQSPAG